MALFKRCDRCDGEMPVSDPKANGTYLVSGTRQGMLGPVPKLVDLCEGCREALKGWLANA